MNKKSALIQRIIFSIVFLIFTIPALLLTSYAGFGGRISGMILLSILAMWGLYEILTTIGINKYVAAPMTLVVPIFFFMHWYDFFNILIHPNVTESDTLASLMRVGLWRWDTWVSLVLFFVIPILIDFNFRKSESFKKKLIILALSLIIIPMFAKATWIICMVDFKFIIFFLCIAIISDTFAYFGGMLFGKKWFKGAKLAPKVSPKKTWAGFVIGLFFSLIFAIVGGYFMHVWSDYKKWEILFSIIFGISLCLVSPFGDLLFSWFKRVAGKKDFSNLIPGHGGIFDRLDAMSSVVCLATIFILMANL